MTTRVGFIGLGHMGGPMCARVVGAGFDVTAFDLSPAALALAVLGGAEAAESAAECAAAADVLITMLPGPPQVEDVLLGSGGALAAMRKGSLAVDMSTSSTELGRRVLEAAAVRGVAFLDAPVADALKASEGDLHIFVGGEEADVAVARPVLEAMGKPHRVVHVGPHGAGYTVKLLVNLQWFVHAAVAAEALAVGVRSGIDADTLYAAFAAGPARSSFLENEALEVLRDGEYGERFPLGLVTKDLGLALDLARETGVRTELSGVTQGLYDQALDKYGSTAGEMAVVRLYEDLAGTPLRLREANGR
ncbi:MAG: NAD(P)-dependent oxidoreductase [Solirubrobacterales bacterium]|jgi:3-hydroxyisobutyrate dehydrogenase|nr:NAD(P)-dependent oxidoreductase [Solirubrobacterales bacterium]